MMNSMSHLNTTILVVVVIITIYWVYHSYTKSDFIIYLNNPQARRGLEAAEGRRTITPDIFPDHDFSNKLCVANTGCYDWKTEGRQLALFKNDQYQNYTVGDQFMSDPYGTKETFMMREKFSPENFNNSTYGDNELYSEMSDDPAFNTVQSTSMDDIAEYNMNEAFVNARECVSAVKSEVNTNRLFVLPERWDNVVCETHCPSHDMVGTRADLGGNLSVDARHTLYDFVPWNVKPDVPDNTVREYVGMQGYSYKENQA